MSHIAVVIQARMGSTRFPGKVLKIAGGHSILWHVITRCRAIKGIDTVCCAIPDTDDSMPVIEEAERCGARVVRGPESDVLARYYKTAKEIGADIVMRITSDCPLIDPAVNGRVLEMLTTGQFDYACNNMPPGFPHGLDCEVFTRAALDKAHANARDPYEREHVTPWLRTSSGIRRANLPGPGAQWTAYRWTLDYPEDLDFFCKLFKLLSPDEILSGYEVIGRKLSEHPEIIEINAAHRDPTRHNLHTTDNE